MNNFVGNIQTQRSGAEIFLVILLAIAGERVGNSLYKYAGNVIALAGKENCSALHFANISTKLGVKYFFHHAVFRHRHLVGESAHHAKIHHQIHIININKYLSGSRCRNFAHTAIDNKKLIFAFFLTVNLKTTRRFHLSRLAIFFKNTLLLYGNKRPIFRHLADTSKDKVIKSIRIVMMRCNMGQNGFKKIKLFRDICM